MIDLSWLSDQFSEQSDDSDLKKRQRDDILYLWIDNENTIDYTPTLAETFFATYIMDRERTDEIWSYWSYFVTGLGGDDPDTFDSDKKHNFPAPFACTIRNVHNNFIINPGSEIENHKFTIKALKRRNSLSHQMFYWTLPAIREYVRDVDTEVLYHACVEHNKNGTWPATPVDRY